MKLCVSKCSAIWITSKCCFCVPLRKGVLIFAYINMAATLLTVPAMLCDVVTRLTTADAAYNQYNVVLIVTTVFLFVDIFVQAVLIIGTHKNKRLLLQIFLYVGSAALALSLGTDIIIFDHTQYIANTVYFFLVFLDVYLFVLVYNLIRIVDEGLEVQYMAYQQGNQLGL
ncbi:uncharacterized protein LOC114366389 [Ostrinia furnacalis]|uniref:uncharacterized protein LOC114366389 n=1 Tax=Ostrinia furnacalis TaxID=93504 RepID=UPI00103C2E2F|nr:uncharacterized protein LOC114366389 [Ostrinia furnacalis]